MPPLNPPKMARKPAKPNAAPPPRAPSSQVQELQTELATLLKLLKPAEKGTWVPIVDEIRISGGHEQAVGAALGDDLDAAADEAAPAHWRLTAGEADPVLPERRHAVE